MAKRKTKGRAARGPLSGWGFFLAACGFGLACIAGGVVVLVFEGDRRQVADPAVPSMGLTGGSLIAMGVVAIGLTVFLLRSKGATGTRPASSRGGR